MKSLLFLFPVLSVACSSGTVSAPQEGRIAVKGGSVWYRMVRKGRKGSPLIVLHGGPGAGHDYLVPLEQLGDERPVILYDQLGSGNSDRPSDERLWNIERFCDEIDDVRKALGLDTVHLLGQSWGTLLAVEYASRPETKGVLSLVLRSR